MNCVSLFWFICLSSFITSEGLIPLECADQVGIANGTCCPVPKLLHGTTGKCGFPQRGVCRPVQVFEAYPKPHRFFQEDRRYLWPTKVFRYACECRGNFYGAACHLCRYGWTGVNCTERVVRTRRSLSTYSQAEKELLRDVLVQLRKVKSDHVILLEPYKPSDRMKWKRVSIHETLVFIHFFAARGIITDNNDKCFQANEVVVSDCNHSGPGFLTWHRHFMLLWERLARMVAKRHFRVRNFTFPYWDWTSRKSCEVCTDELFGGEGKPTSMGNRLSSRSPFHDWKVYCAGSSMLNTTECVPCHFGDTDIFLTRSWTNLRFPHHSYIASALSKFYYYDYSRVDKEERSDPMYCRYFESFLEGNCPLPGSSRRDRNFLFLHNRVHNSCNGTFHSPKQSANDPLFVVHHLQIDRLFQKWFQRTRPHPSQFPNLGFEPGQCRNCNLVGVWPPVAHRDFFTDTRSLGYIYDNYEFNPPRA